MGRTRAGGLVLLAGGLAAAGAGWTWVAVGLLLVGFLAATRRLTGWAYALAGLATTAGLLVAASRAGLTAADVGLGLADLPRGLVWSVVVAAATVAAVTATALLARRSPRLAELFADQPGDLRRIVLLDIALGTVLVEEVAFRGVLLALLTPWSSVPAAVAVTALLFGLWHLPGVRDAGGGAREALQTVVATAAGGAGLALLRLGTGSLLPALALHLALNAAGAVAARHRASAEASTSPDRA